MFKLKLCRDKEIKKYYFEYTVTEVDKDTNKKKKRTDFITNKNDGKTELYYFDKVNKLAGNIFECYKSKDQPPIYFIIHNDKLVISVIADVNSTLFGGTTIYAFKTKIKGENRILVYSVLENGESHYLPLEKSLEPFYYVSNMLIISKDSQIKIINFKINDFKVINDYFVYDNIKLDSRHVIFISKNMEVLSFSLPIMTKDIMDISKVHGEEFYVIKSNDSNFLVKKNEPKTFVKLDSIQKVFNVNEHKILLIQKDNDTYWGQYPLFAKSSEEIIIANESYYLDDNLNIVKIQTKEDEKIPDFTINGIDIFVNESKVVDTYGDSMYVKDNCLFIGNSILNKAEESNLSLDIDCDKVTVINNNIRTKIYNQNVKKIHTIELFINDGVEYQAKFDIASENGTILAEGTFEKVQASLVGASAFYYQGCLITESILRKANYPRILLEQYVAEIKDNRFYLSDINNDAEYSFVADMIKITNTAIYILNGTTAFKMTKTGSISKITLKKWISLEYETVFDVENWIDKYDSMKINMDILNNMEVF